jgi:hypothetical protein
MTAFTLLIICLAAQILIAGGLGVYLLRHFLRQRKEKPHEGPTGVTSSGESK